MQWTLYVEYVTNPQSILKHNKNSTQSSIFYMRLALFL